MKKVHVSLVLFLDIVPDYKNESVQEFRFALSQKIREQVFYAHLVENIESAIKSNAVKNALKQWIQK